MHSFSLAILVGLASLWGVGAPLAGQTVLIKRYFPCRNCVCLLGTKMCSRFEALRVCAVGKCSGVANVCVPVCGGSTFLPRLGLNAIGPVSLRTLADEHGCSSAPPPSPIPLFLDDNVCPLGKLKDHQKLRRSGAERIVVCEWGR